MSAAAAAAESAVGGAGGDKPKDDEPDTREAISATTFKQKLDQAAHMVRGQP